MSKPLRVVVVGDAHTAALNVASDLEQGGFEPSVFLAPGEADLERIAPGCELIVAWADATGLPPLRVIEMAVEGSFPPVIVCSEAFTEDAIVGLVRAGARDCVRRGDVARLGAAVLRERGRAVSRLAGSRADAEAADRYRALIEEIPALTYVAWADDTGSRAYVSPQLLAMTGFSPGEWLAEPDMWVRRLHPEDRERVLRQFRDACASGGRFASEYRVLDREGRVLWWRDEGRSLPGPDGKARFVRGFVLDITEQRLAEESLRKMRFFDQLTGLPNRVLLQNRLGRALAESVRTDRPLALLILALDRFREITNTLGHHNGDLIVRELAVRLGDALGDGDRVARLRGDEFGVLLPDADATFARQVGERILGSLERPFMVQRLPIEVSASVGMAVAPEHGTEAETLLRRADSAVQAARKLGGERASSTRPAASCTTPRGSPSSASCAARSKATSCSCTTSPRWTSRPTPWWGRRRCCAGPIRSGASCRPRSSSRWRSRPGSSARSPAGCSTARRERRAAGSGRDSACRWRSTSRPGACTTTGSSTTSRKRF